MRMRLNILLIFPLALSLICTAANAQEEKKPVFSLALTLGANSFASVSAMPGTQDIYETQAPAVNWMDKKIGFGIETGLQIGQSWRIMIGGSFSFGSNPGHPGLSGTTTSVLPAEYKSVQIPTYNSVAAQRTLSYLAYTGFDYLFDIIAVPKLKPLLGFRAGGSYAADSKRWDDPLTMGASVAEAYYFKGAIVGGADYFFTNNFFIGITLNLFDYTYTVTRYKPQEGLAALSADGHLFGAIANPALRIGFCFGK